MLASIGRNKEIIADSIGIFIDRIPVVYDVSCRLASNDGLDGLIKQCDLLLEVKVPRLDLVRDIGNEIGTYTNYYKVVPYGSIDEAKALYFTGMVLAEKAEFFGYSELSKIFQHTTVIMLDLILNYSFGTHRIEMSKAMHKLVDENKFKEHTGKYGMYLIYKGMYKFKKQEEMKKKSGW